MPDIFGSNKTLAGSIKGTSVAMTVANGGGDVIAGAMVQSVQLQYSRQISRIFELGSENMYYNVGNSEGQGSIQAIAGPKGMIAQALSALTKVCSATKQAISFTGGTELCGTTDPAAGGGSESVSVTASGAVLQATSIAVSTQDFLMQSGGQIMFAELKLGGKDGGGDAPVVV